MSGVVRHALARAVLHGCVALAVTACGSGSPDEGVDAATPMADAATPTADAGPNARYLPLAVGASWTYRVTDTASGAVADKTSTVEAFEDVGGAKAGVMAFRVRTDKLNGYTISWQQDSGTAILRHRELGYDASGTQTTEETYDPAKLRIDESAAHTGQGATFDDTYVETATPPGMPATMLVKTETWTVEATAESITVPAGTFSCLRLHRVDAATGSDKRYWFARGVGKIREEGLGQTEELTGYTLP